MVLIKSSSVPVMMIIKHGHVIMVVDDEGHFDGLGWHAIVELLVVHVENAKLISITDRLNIDISVVSFKSISAIERLSSSLAAHHSG